MDFFDLSIDETIAQLESVPDSQVGYPIGYMTGLLDGINYMMRLFAKDDHVIQKAKKFLKSIEDNKDKIEALNND